MTTQDERARRSSGGRPLRPSAKVLPEHARVHNRALVLQTLYRSGRQSRADVARSTGLTRVTVSDLVAELMEDGLVVELGRREVAPSDGAPSDGAPSEGAHRGKPAILLDIDHAAFQIIGVDLGDYAVFRGAVLDLGGTVLHRAEVPLAGGTGTAASSRVGQLIERLRSEATSPVLGIGIGSPGVVDDTGVVLSAPNLGWVDEPVQADIAARFSLPVVVVNDANVAVLAEHSFGDAEGDTMLVKVGHGVGAGLLLGGVQLFGSRFTAGEIGHVVVDPDGEPCSCGKSGCLETWLAIPRLEAKLARATTSADRDAVLREAGERLGIALAPVVGALGLTGVVLSGPSEHLDGVLVDAAASTLRARTMTGEVTLRLTRLGDDIVLRGAAAAVLSQQLGVS